MDTPRSILKSGRTSVMDRVPFGDCLVRIYLPIYPLTSHPQD